MRLTQPEILRFATDSFMDDFLAMLERDPAQLYQYIAQPETWRGPLASPDPVPQVPGLVRRLKRLGLAVARQQAATAQPTTIATGQGSKKPLPFKLYQPAHQRYYLVAASLVCARAGLPDRTVDSGRQERTTFVIRRLLPAQAVDSKADLPDVDQKTWEEYALVATPQAKGWVKVGPGNIGVLASGEEVLPLFATNYTEDDGRRRRMLSGLIPVGKREHYMGAALLNKDKNTQEISQPGNLPKTSRKILFRKQVTEPWKRLIDRAYADKTILTAPPAPPFGGQAFDVFQKALLKKASREVIQTGSWYILLDLAEYLEQYLPDVWVVIKGLTQENDLADPGQHKKNLLNALRNTKLNQDLKTELLLRTDPLRINSRLAHPFYDAADVKESLFEALKTIDEWREKLENATGSYDREKSKDGAPSLPDPTWPDFLFPLADIECGGPTIPDGAAALTEADNVDPDAAIKETSVQGPPDSQAKIAAQDNIDKLVAFVVRALPIETVEPSPPIPLAAQPMMDTRAGWFVIRCVFERPCCEPLETAIVSAPTRPFQMAGFFDSDAPARPIRIALPIDTTPAGLRKFDKNTAFMISDVLCGQIERMKGLSFGDLVMSVLPWPFHKDLDVKADKGPCKADPSLNAGMICTLSIPIITICALILLLMIVAVLDIIFRWIPYFIMCFPLPGFRAKKA
jgi:hypothetical protein